MKFGDVMSLARQSTVNLIQSALEEVQDSPKDLEMYYRQPRFSCGQLFVGTIITSLVTNSFYNPTLIELVSTMIGAQIIMTTVGNEWAGKSYFEYFDYLLFTESKMAVAMFRDVPKGEAVQMEGGAAKHISSTAAPSRSKVTDAGDPALKARRTFSYVYTAPPAKETTMRGGDRVICFGMAAPQVLQV